MDAAYSILVDEAVRMGVPLLKALEKHERWARRRTDLDETTRTARQNDRQMERFMRGQRG